MNLCSNYRNTYRSVITVYDNFNIRFIQIINQIFTVANVPCLYAQLYPVALHLRYNVHNSETHSIYHTELFLAKTEIYFPHW